MARKSKSSIPADLAIGFRTRLRKLPTRYAVPVVIGKKNACGLWRSGCLAFHVFKSRARSGGTATQASDVSVFVSGSGSLPSLFPSPLHQCAVDQHRGLQFSGRATPLDVSRKTEVY